MPYLLNLVYLAAWLVLSPWLAYRALTAGKYRRGMWTKWTGRVEPLPAGGGPVVWFHGVSVGEVHLLRPVLALVRQRRPDWRCVVSTTTDTGYDEARKHFPDLPVILWPFDFTWAVNAALARVRPDLVVLAEGETWPNFVRAARRRGVRLAVINGRMSPRSAARYRKLGGLVRGLFRSFDFIGAQTAEYAEHYRALGAERVELTGNIKYDGVLGDRHDPRTAAMRQLLGIGSHELVWVAGSTQDPEERIALNIYRRTKALHPHLRLIVVPRHRERFNEVARLLEQSGLPFVRRSALPVSVPPDAVILGDTMGELSAVWGLADVAFVGGSLDGKRGGQNMIEPAAFGAAVLFGPHTWNFRQTVDHLLAHDAAIRVADATALEREVLRLLGDADLRTRLGDAARRFVRSQQGATARTLDCLERLLPMSARQAA